MKDLFTLRGTIDKKKSLIIEIIGFILLIFAWWLTSIIIDSKVILPSPLAVLGSFGDLYTHDKLVSNTFTSISLNVWGYVEAVIIAIPLGFLIGLMPLFKALSSRYIDAMRFIPLSALIGIFITWFGIGSAMKAHFLAFGIIVYLLPVVVLRISELEEVYVQTAYTLGASKWQIIKKVFIPGVLSKLIDDIRVLVAISWTYIIIAEVINRSEGGIGAAIFNALRQSRLDKMFALLFIIILIGIIQDRCFKLLDKILFPHKYI